MTVHLNPEDIIDQGESNAPTFSEIDLTERFVAEHAAYLRFVAAWGKWFHFDGKRWGEEMTLRAFDMARAICKPVQEAGRPETPREREHRRRRRAPGQGRSKDRRYDRSVGCGPLAPQHARRLR